MKVYLDDYANWTNAQLHENLRVGNPVYRYVESAWARQHDFTRWAMNALTPASSAVREPSVFVVCSRITSLSGTPLSYRLSVAHILYIFSCEIFPLRRRLSLYSLLLKSLS